MEPNAQSLDQEVRTDPQIGDRVAVMFRGREYSATIVDLSAPQALGLRTDEKAHDDPNLDGHGISVGRMSKHYRSLTPEYQPHRPPKTE